MLVYGAHLVLQMDRVLCNGLKLIGSCTYKLVDGKRGIPITFAGFIALIGFFPIDIAILGLPKFGPKPKSPTIP